MAQEIYHRSEWGNPNEQWGNVYLNADLTNELYKRASEYENSWVTDQLLNGVGTKPSIILTPTAYEDGVLNSVKPAKTYSDEITVNGNFDTDSDWSKSNATISGGKGNLDGDGQTSLLWQDILTNGKTYKATFTVSDYNELGEARLINNNGVAIYTITSNGTFTINFTHSIANGNFLFRAKSGAIFSIDNVSVKEVTDADFDFTRGSSATRVNELGLVQDVTDTDLPRINYTNFDYENGEVVPYSGEGSLLLEGQSTNLFTQSELFNVSNWIKIETIVEAATITLPNGLSDGYKLFANTTEGTNHWIEKSPFPTATTGQDYTLSLFVKSAGSDFIQIASSTGFPAKYQNFNISMGTKANGDISDSSITDFGNGWYRISVTETTVSTNARYLIVPILSDGARNPQFSGNTDEDGVYIWGAQLEQGSYATSYIPTNGSTVTRLADVCNNSGSSDLINSTEGVLYAEISALANDGTVRYFGLNDGSNDNRAVFLFDSTANRVRAIVSSGGTKYVDFNYTVTDLTEFHKIALKYKADDFALWIDGVERNTDTSGLTPIGLDNLEFDLNLGGALYANVKCLAVFKEALSDTELQKLTTI